MSVRRHECVEGSYLNDFVDSEYYRACSGGSVAIAFFFRFDS